MTLGSPPRPPQFCGAIPRARLAATWSMLSTLSTVAILAPMPRLHAQASRDVSHGAGGTVARPQIADSLTPARLLAALQATADSASPELAARRAQLDATRARAHATGFASPLTLSAGISEAPNANLDQGNMRVEVGRDLFLGPRLRAERGVAAADVVAAAAALATAARRVRLSVLREAVRAAGARLIAVRLSAEDALLAGGEDGVRARFSVGQARYVEVLRLRTERLRVQSERAAALAEARAATAALRGLVGRVRDAGVSRTTEDARFAAMLDTLATPTLADAWRHVLPDTAVTDAMLDSVIASAGDVRLADAAVARSHAERALANASRRPQVSALAGLQRIGQANSGRALGPSVGVTISLPFTAGVANRRADTADTQRVIAVEASREATRTLVRARVEAAAERYAAARERLEVFDAALLRGVRDERESALASYRSGAVSLLELVDFERALARAEIGRIRALVDAAAAWADLATGDLDAAPPTFFTPGSGPEDGPDAH